MCTILEWGADPDRDPNLDRHQIGKSDLDRHQHDTGTDLGSVADTDRINLQITSQNVLNMRLFEHFFKVEPFFGS
jgi:hypothetical protein